MSIAKVVQGQPTTDGAGVRLTRMIGTAELDMIDPFLMLDRFDNDDPGAYIGGFPDHPHRGFETVTIMLDGRMRHRDSTGGEGIIGPGDVQWMTAGRGIIHSEMPEQIEGRMRGFQLWLNLPAKEKMTPAGYQDILADTIPIVNDATHSVRVIAGTYENQSGPAATRTPVRLLQVTLESNATISLSPAAGQNAFVCVYEGCLNGKPSAGTEQNIVAPALAVLTPSNDLHFAAGIHGAAFLYGEGTPINEPVARYGPFVMNTRAELQKAVLDYNSGQFV